MKTITKWFRDNPVVVLHVLRAQVAASHLLLMKEIRGLQDKPFDMAEELTLLLQRQQSIAELLDLKVEEACLAQLKDKHVARQKKREPK